MFEIGKIPPQILERIVLDPVTHSKVHREDIVVRPKTRGRLFRYGPQRGTVRVLHRPHYWRNKRHWLSGSTYQL